MKSKRKEKMRMNERNPAMQGKLSDSNDSLRKK